MSPATGRYEKLDQPEILAVLFHPREETPSPPSGGAVDYEITVDDGVALGARFHMSGKEDPNILFFHGNGEIVGDYDSIGPFYNEQGLNFLAVDYRGYGRSGGTPTATSMMQDCHIIFKEVKSWLAEQHYTGPLIVMGRSLGSASAIELAASYQDDIAGLIIESGFAQTLPLLLALGVDIHSMGITEMNCFQNVQKIAGITTPTFMLHAQKDQIIPLTSAEILQAQSPARSKEFQIIPGADHNTIFDVVGKLYFEAIKRFTNKIQGKRPKRYTRRR